MPKIEITPLPRAYSFVVNGYKFVCQLEWRADEGVSQKDILVRDLEECLVQLKAMPEFRVTDPFNLPPVNPDDTSRTG